MTEALDAAVAGFQVERWVTRADERGIAIARDDGGRRLVSVLGGPARPDDPARTTHPGWDLPLVSWQDGEAGLGSTVVEDLPDGVPSTWPEALAPSTVTGTTGTPPFVVDIARRMADAHAAGELVGRLHPALVFVRRSGELTGIAQRALRTRVPAPPEGRVPLFETRYASPGDLREAPPTVADDVFRLAALCWRWRHGAAPLGSGAEELGRTLAGGPLPSPVDDLDHLLVWALAGNAGADGTAGVLAAALEGSTTWRLPASVS